MLEKPGAGVGAGEATTLRFSDHFYVSVSDFDPKPVSVHTRYQTRNPKVLHQRAERVLASFLWISASLSHTVLPESKFLIWTWLWKEGTQLWVPHLMSFFLREWIKSSRLKSKLPIVTDRAVTLTTCSLPMEPFSCLCASAYTFVSTLLVGHGLHRPSEFKLSHLEKEGNKSTLRERKTQQQIFFITKSFESGHAKVLRSTEEEY